MRNIFSSKKTIVVLALFLVGVALFVLLQKKPSEAPLSENAREHKSFDLSLSEFSHIHRAGLIVTSEAIHDNGKKEDAKIAGVKIWNSWKLIVRDFASAQPENFKRTENWTVNLEKISKMLELANEDMIRADFVGAEKKMKDANRLLGDMRFENNISNPDDVFFAVYESVKKITEAKNRADAIKHLPALKLKFIECKNFDYSPEYQKALSDVEKAISDIENSTNKTFPSYQPKLMIVFRKLFLSY